MDEVTYARVRGTSLHIYECGCRERWYYRKNPGTTFCCKCSPPPEDHAVSIFEMPLDRIIRGPFDLRGGVQPPAPFTGHYRVAAEEHD